MASRVTAMDIEKHEFRRAFRGLDSDDVRMFLKSVSEEVERLNLENGRLLEELGEMKSKLDEHRSREKALQQTLLSAQAMADEQKERARRDADLVMREARARAEDTVRDAKEALRRLESDIERAQAEREGFELRLRGVVEQHMTLLEMRREARSTPDNVRVIRPGVESGAG